jgi:Ca2+-binding RTX toxin-like protein
MGGRQGDDTYVVDDAGDEVVEFDNEGIDTVRASVSYTLTANVEKLTLTGTGALTGTGNNLANTILGNAAANKLYGLGGNDTITGGDGNDTIDGGEGIDRMSGGFGDDTYYVDNILDVVGEGVGAGYDTILSTVSFTMGANVERLVLLGNANINGTGGSGNDLIIGNDGANRLAGGIGNDDLFGGAGQDVLVGDAGLDRMWGGSEADRFFFARVADANGDRIEDFEAGDKIDLSVIDANTLLRADQAFTFIGDVAFSGQAGQLRAVRLDEDFSEVSGDINGDGIADFVITVQSANTLNAADFIL